MFGIKKILCVALLAGAVAGYSNEQTGKEFNQLVKELNQEFADAKVKIKEVREEHEQVVEGFNKDALKERQTSLEKLKELNQKLDVEEDAEQKVALESQVQAQILQVAEKSADFLEVKKMELVTQDKELEIMEDALSNVILKLDRLERKSAQLQEEASSQEIEAEKLETRKELRKMAIMIEAISKANPQATHFKGVRRSIMLQDKMLRKDNIQTEKIENMLGEQKRIFEQAHQDIVLSRQELAEEKSLLARISLGEVTKSMLRKASTVLLGNNSVEEIGFKAFEASAERQQSMLEFLEQDQSEEVAAGFDSESADLPIGYEDYLNADIK